MKTIGSKIIVIILLVTIIVLQSCKSESPSHEVFQVLTNQFLKSNTIAKSDNVEIVNAILSKIARTNGDELSEAVGKEARNSMLLIEEFTLFVQDIKSRLVEHDQVQLYNEGDNSYMHGAELIDPENTEVVQDVMFTEPFLGNDLKNRMNETRTQLINGFAELKWIDEREVYLLDSLMSLDAPDFFEEDDIKVLWEYKMFNGVTKSAAIALLTMIENQALQSQRAFLGCCYRQFSSSGLTIREFEMVSTPNDYVLALGDTFQTKVFLTESLFVTDAEIWVDGEEVDQKYSLGDVIIVPNKKGAHSHKVQLRYINKKTGKPQEHIGEIRYYVY